MRIHVFASGSGGNCLLLEDRETRILIDAGISKRRVMETLAGLGLRMEQIGGPLQNEDFAAVPIFAQKG